VAPGGVYEFLVIGGSGIADVKNNVPKFFEPYPNPANESVMLGYFIPVNEMVEIKLFDINGKELFSLDEPNTSAGTHSLELSVSSLSSGVYTLRFQSGNSSIIRRLVKM